MLYGIGYVLRNRRRGEEDEEQNAAERLVRAGAPDAEKIKQLDAEKAKGLVRREAIAAGKTEEEADATAASTGLGSATPNLDRGVQTPNLDKLARANSPMGGGGETAGATVSFKSSGEEYMYKAKNAIRALQGLPPVEQELNPRDKFQVDVEKSISFGDKSGLLTPTGHVKAFESGIRAGYSTDEVNGMLQGARDRLKPKGDAEVLSNARGPSAQATPSNTTGVLLPQATEGTEANTVGVLAPKELTDTEKVAKANTDAIRFTDELKRSEEEEKKKKEGMGVTPPNTLITQPVTLGSINNKIKATEQRAEDLSYNSGVLNDLVASVKKSGSDLNVVLDTLFTGGDDNVKAYRNSLTTYDKYKDQYPIEPPKFEEVLKALKDSDAMSKTSGLDDATKAKVLDYRTKKWNKGDRS